MRVSQFLFNLDKMKEQARDALLKQARTSRTVATRPSSGVASRVSSSSSLDTRDKAAGKNIDVVQHAISSLSGVRDSKQFGEVLDVLFVPTVQAYRQKEKERPFRRPTQNPRPSRHSSSPSQRAAARQRYEAKQKLI